MLHGREPIRIRVVNKDGIDDVEMWAWADTTVGAFKRRLAIFYKAPPGLINLVLQVGLERYVLARMHRIKLRSPANSTIDGGAAILSSLSKTGPPRHLHVEGDPVLDRGHKIDAPLIDGRIHGISKSRAMHSC